ncbi:3',5'-cyclic adenosine monophosphate phosphodiesterase CpdA [Symmachiella macrocystis]|uniref:3',5'-cyclic adenosine monophosphate phosphodiesterase CpdA n=1 Tax=Symmachiella macrocystis TaxID=2527985 RepID=A0A5C6B343_9PLAN|nr:phosphodiesterase [Symmachiella macrocystis]TWU06735.1 3',5'-cyclic adenosine monophosphate phosphodiesterase CpdA [Symmachiella macrocystis]
MTTHILQLSDFHLLKNHADELRGVPTADCLTDLLTLVRANYSAADLFVLSGDIAAYGDVEAYHQTRELLADLLPRCVMIPGNHDETDLMRQAFPETIAGSPGPVTFSCDVAGWRMIGLDSHVAGAVHGELCGDQLQWLADEFSQHRDQATLLFMHHPPISVESTWLDRIMLRNANDLTKVLHAAPQVRGIFCGHVHQEFSGSFGAIPVHTTPATAIQFAPHTEELQFDNVPPGFRVIELDGDKFHTHIVRLPELKYPAT